VCAEEDVAVGLACPVVAKHPARGEMVIHGGAVHLSKDFLLGTEGHPVFGRIARFTGNGWGKLVDETYVSAVSQEHGIVRAQPGFMDQTQIGDLLVVLPVHSCLTANLMGQYISLSGEVIPMMGAVHT
jgi:D-serine deaminase-like pyridoxal phosphate-dependent protein